MTMLYHPSNPFHRLHGCGIENEVHIKTEDKIYWSLEILPSLRRWNVGFTAIIVVHRMTINDTCHEWISVVQRLLESSFSRVQFKTWHEHLSRIEKNWNLGIIPSHLRRFVGCIRLETCLHVDATAVRIGHHWTVVHIAWLVEMQLLQCLLLLYSGLRYMICQCVLLQQRQQELGKMKSEFGTDDHGAFEWNQLSSECAPVGTQLPGGMPLQIKSGTTIRTGLREKIIWERKNHGSAV